MPVENPLSSIVQPFPFDTLRAEHIVPAVDALLRRSEQRIEAISAAPRTYEGTLGALDIATRELDFAVTIASHLELVDGSPDVREAYAAIVPKTTELGSKIILSGPLYQALLEFAETDEAKRLDPVRARFLKNTLADFRRNGAALDEAGKKRVADIDLALAELTMSFGRNVVDDTMAFEILLPDAARLDGLPDGAIEAARRSAEAAGKPGYRLTLQAPSYMAVVTYANDRALRETIYRAYTTRAVSGAADNRPIILKVLALRKEKAKILGFRNFADLALEDRMAKSGDNALAFVTMLKDKLAGAFARENEELARFAAANGHTGPLEAWDTTYWAEKQRRELHAFDEETLRPYHPLDRILRGLFEIASALYGVRIERDRAAPVWHPDATAWSIGDENGQRFGTFYLDLFPRDGKRDGAWMSGVLEKAPGRNEQAIAIIVANVTPPRGPGQEALLDHREVETLFHEFGHATHHLFSDVRVRSMSGTRVPADFVELPSMIMENWTWERDALDRFARHHESGAPIPDDTKDRMLAARSYRAANALMRQVGFSTVDLLLHTVFDETKDDVMSFSRDVFAKFSPTKLPDDYAFIAGFTHLFGSAYGYAAGYYSYQWSSMLEADAFRRFKDGGILSREIGSAFRDQILSRGDSDDAAALYRSFLGRDPDVGALLTRLGIAA